MDSSSVLSFPSEPPDIKIWFSSYEYETPESIDVEGDLKGLSTSQKKIDGGKEKTVESIDCVGRHLCESTKGERFSEVSEQDCNPEKKMIDSSSLFSFPSEPPDIRNWFSSYENESPALFDGEGDSEGLITSQKEIDVGKEKTMESLVNLDNHDDCVGRPLYESIKGERFSDVSEQERNPEKKDLYSDEVTELSPYSKSFLSRRIYEDHFQGQVLDKRCYISSINNVNLTVEDEGPREKMTGKCFRKYDSVFSEVDQNALESQDKSIKKSFHKKCFEEQELGEDLGRYASHISAVDAKKSNGNPLEKPLLGINNKEEKKDFSNDGFISTKNNKPATLNTHKFSGGFNLRNDMHSSVGTHLMVTGEIISSVDDENINDTNRGAGPGLHEKKREMVGEGNAQGGRLPLNGNYSRKYDPIPSEMDQNSSKDHDNSAEKSFYHMHFKEQELEGKYQRKHVSSRSALALKKSNGSSLGKHLSGSNGKEEGGDFSNGVFISKKNSNTEKPNTKKYPNEINLRNDPHPAAGKHLMVIDNDEKLNDDTNMEENIGKEYDIDVGILMLQNKNKLAVVGDAQVGRMALSDRTNFCTESKPEKSGKWQCPRKGKPFVGPPLKQLRLERWVHRVQ